MANALELMNRLN